MKKSVKFGVALLLGAVLFALILPDMCSAAPDPILQQIYEVFRNNRDNWLERMGDILSWTFFALLGISFAWKSTQLALADQLGAGSILLLFAKTCIYAGLFKFVFMNVKWGDSGSYVILVDLIPDSFTWIARQVTGEKVNVFLFIETATQVFGLILNKSVGMAGDVILAVVACFISVMFYMIVGQIIMTMIETVMITLAGFVLLVFDGLMDMFNYWQTYFRALIACGFKLFMLNIICGIFLKFARDMTSIMQNNGVWAGVMIMSGTVCVMYLIAKNVPALVAAVLSGSHAGTSSGVIGNVATMAATMAAMKVLGGVKTAGTMAATGVTVAGYSALTKMGLGTPQGDMRKGQDDGSKG